MVMKEQGSAPKGYSEQLISGVGTSRIAGNSAGKATATQKFVEEPDREEAQAAEAVEAVEAARVKAATATFFFDLGSMLHGMIGTLQCKVFDAMQAQGFWEGPQDNFSSKIALLHSELSELLEANREGNPRSEKIPGYTCEEEEAADLLIRLLDMAGRYDWALGAAVATKMRYNMTRPRKHGKVY